MASLIAPPDTICFDNRSREATTSEIEAQGDDAATRAFCVQYRLRDAAALEHYLQEHAPRMRADGEARFGGRFSASRRILQPFAPA